MEALVAIAVLAIALVVVAAAFVTSRIVLGPDEAAVVFRLGRTEPGMVLRSGTHFVIPIVDRPARVRLDPVTTKVATAATTRDEDVIQVEVALQWRVVDPYLAVVTVVDVATAVDAVVGTAARETVAAHSRTALLSDPTGLTRSIAARLADPFERWGVGIDSLTASAG